MKFECIWACDEQGGIGREGIIPWNVPQDLKHFRETTTGEDDFENVVIMGRKTWESLPQMFKPLKDRINIVITSDLRKIEDIDKWDKRKVVFVPDFESALIISEIIVEQSPKPYGDVYVIGGGMVYEQAIQHESCVGVHETVVSGAYGCDTFAPMWNTDDYDLVEQNDLSFRAQHLYWRKKGTYYETLDESLLEEIFE
jgi:dihydrofolate reductase